MTFNWDFNAGTVVPIVVAIGGGLARIMRRLHNSEIQTEVRHIQNTGKFQALEESHNDIKSTMTRLADTQKNCQDQITKTREMVVRLDERSNPRT